MGVMGCFLGSGILSGEEGVMRAKFGVMARKETRIQMDGMCRVPSSRPVKDGMASESLNLVSDMGECVPVLPPSLAEGEDIPDSWRTDNGEMVFVHVQPTYEHHIYQTECEDGLVGIGTWAVDDDGGWVFTAFMEMAEGETLNGVVGVGNTLVVSTSEATHYVLWKEGSYRDLGTELPKPAVQFVGGEREMRNIFRDSEVNDAPDAKVWLAVPRMTSERDDEESKSECCAHGFYFCGSDGKYSYDEDKPVETENARIQAIWNAYANAVAFAAEYNGQDWVKGRAFYQPYLFRYALRLYDGTYAKQSVPMLVGGGVTWPQFLGDVHLDGSYGDGHGNGNGRYGFAMVPMFSVRAIMEEAVSEDWADIVTAVDIFCSSPINPCDTGDGAISDMYEDVYITELQDYFDNDVGGSHMISPKNDNKCILARRYGITDDRMEGVILNHNVFYRIGSFLIDNSGFTLDDDYDPAQEFTANQEDLVAGIQLKKPDADTLVTHTSTASTDWDDYGADSTYHGNVQKVMNQRLAIWDIDETLGRGLNVLNGQSTLRAYGGGWDENGDAIPYSISDSALTGVYRFCYVLDDDGTERWVWGGSSYYVMADAEADRGRLFAPYRNATTVSPKDALGFLYEEPVICAPFAWLAYPDKNCKRVLFQKQGVSGFYYNGALVRGKWGDVMTLPMKEHPFLNCAYAWLGFANALEGATATEEDARRFNDYYEDRLVRDTNTIMLSGAANPFTFPTAGRYTFDYAVVSCATANMPLSTGQFGDFPLYVFTKGGIWAMRMNTDGTFASSSPFSRDVAVSHRGVCEIDQGIIFISEKAVLAIQGGQITDISQLMTGRHDPLPDSAVSVLENCGYGVEADDDAHTVLVPISALKDVWTDGSAFMAFMADATAGYDYKGDRMIFINGNFRWQWVWMRKTATWHRTMLWEGDYITDSENVAGAGAVRIRSFVNSWPGLLANLIGTGKGAEVCAVGEMTSQLDRTRDETLASTGLYVSRPLTLDSPDVFKSVMDLRIRGDLKRGNARHLLMSSNNGRDWVLRRSLRGPSFRFHRIAVVTRMTAQERLSYLDVEYDERFTNRLR